MNIESKRNIFLYFLFFYSFCFAVLAQGQHLYPTSGSTRNENSGLVLKKVWTKNFEKNSNIYSAYILLGSDQKFQNVVVNNGDIFLFDLNGNEKKEETSKDGNVYLSSRGKRIVIGDSSWKIEDSGGNLIKKSSNVELLEEKLLFSPDDSLMVGKGYEDDNAALYDAEGNLIKKIEGEVGGVSFSPDSQFIGLISRNPHKPKLKDEFYLLDNTGNLIFALPLDSNGVACSFTEDGSRIFLVSEFYLYVMDLKGNVICKTAEPHRDAFGSIVFLNQNLFVTAGLSNIWKVDVSSGTAKFESIQQIDFPRGVEKIGNNLAIIYGVEKTGPYPGTDMGLEIISPTGQLLASMKLTKSWNGIQVKGDYIVVWDCCSLSLLKFSAE